MGVSFLDGSIVDVEFEMRMVPDAGAIVDIGWN